MVLGGYGHFGERICRGLASDAFAELVVAGRRMERAGALAHTLRQVNPRASVRSAQLDRSAASFEHDLAALRPTTVIHAAGPFQSQDYRVAKACLRQGRHYVDLADSRRFVAEFPELDDAARRQGVLLVTGASTLPAVSSAVADDLGADLQRIERIETAILPANRTERGLGTIAAVFSYVGKRIPVLENGRWTTRHGWHDMRWIEHPDCARRAALCDVPDLHLFAHRYPGVRTVTFHAGLELAWQQRGMWMMAWLARLGLVGDWSKYSGAFAKASARLISLGSDIGGMQVRLVGRDRADTRIERTWNLTAGSNHGPEIPCIPARVLAKKLVLGEMDQRGAMPCMGLMSLDDFGAAAAQFDIAWGVTEKTG